MDDFSQPTFEHPLDIFRAAHQAFEKNIKFALAFVTETKGGSVRRPGAVMLVEESGQSLGYVSGGCIDSDVCAQAVEALSLGQSRLVKYGADSPYLDLNLPCGGTIVLHTIVSPNRTVIAKAMKVLESGTSFDMSISPEGELLSGKRAHNFAVTYVPKLNLRIAGRGHDALALARLANQSGLHVTIQSPDLEDLNNTPEHIEKEHLMSALDIPNAKDNPYTAFALMFHDTDWEPALLKQALAGNAFYIGAVGSRHTHAKRAAKLAELGVKAADIARIKGPIGLVPSMRDSSMLAISTLAEIVHAFHAKYHSAKPA